MEKSESERAKALADVLMKVDYKAHPAHHWEWRADGLMVLTDTRTNEPISDPVESPFMSIEESKICYEFNQMLKNDHDGSFRAALRKAAQERRGDSVPKP